MKKILIANWKANPPTLREAAKLARRTERAAAEARGIDVIVAPPFPFLETVALILKRAKLGSQNAFWEDTGPYTGEVSWRQLKGIKVSHVIVGHSERRLLLGETDEMIAKKVCVLLEHGLTPILCVGECERVEHEISETVAHQITAALAGVKKNLVKNLIIAYEPVWAISTMPPHLLHTCGGISGSRPDTPENAFRANMYIRKIMSRLFGRNVGESIQIIYGGSVNAQNISSFLTDGRMQGALVGSASLNAEEFTRIIATLSA